MCDPIAINKRHIIGFLMKRAIIWCFCSTDLRDIGKKAGDFLKYRVKYTFLVQSYMK